MNKQSSFSTHSTTEQLELFSAGKVLPYGYGCDPDMTKLLRLMKVERAYLVDIRLFPHSEWHVGFNKDALAKLFPRRYMHMPELGNLHYRKEDRKKGIKLANPEQGIARLKKGLSQGYTLILMGTGEKGCHRWTVVKLLKETMKKEAMKEQN